MVGLGVTINSLIRNCSATEKLKLFFICAYISEKHKKRIESLLKDEKFEGKFRFINFDPVSIFGAYGSLHGDWTTYGRLLLCDLIDEDTILYLDSDLVIEVDVLKLCNFNFEDKALAAVCGGTLRTELENDFYIRKVGLKSNIESFNAGILYFNLKEWRLNNIKEQCFDLANRFPSDLVSHDQTLLNAVFAGNFTKLPSSFNCPWLPNYEQPLVATGGAIYHYVGSPKPWDLFGSLIHNGYKVWKNYSTRNWERNYSSYSLQNLQRTWNIRRSYFRVLKSKSTF